MSYSYRVEGSLATGCAHIPGARSGGQSLLPPKPIARDRDGEARRPTLSGQDRAHDPPAAQDRRARARQGEDEADVDLRVDVEDGRGAKEDAGPTDVLHLPVVPRRVSDRAVLDGKREWESAGTSRTPAHRILPVRASRGRRRRCRRRSLSRITPRVGLEGGCLGGSVRNVNVVLPENGCCAFCHTLLSASPRTPEIGINR